MKLAHIINPVIVPESSDLYVAEPVTFESMRIARDLARGKVEVELFSTCYPEDRPLAPEGFSHLRDLDRSVLDVAQFAKPRRLPLLKDILDRLYEATPHADFLIYTNVDIALMPYFYSAVQKLLELSYDALVINRRTISDKYQRIDQLPLMFSELGRKHSGYDCFIFKRSAYSRYRLGDACVGAGGIGKVLVSNMVCHSSKFMLLKEEHLTFHIGDTRVWRNNDQSDYTAHNWAVLRRILKDLEKEKGSFENNSLPASFLRNLEPAPHSSLKGKLKELVRLFRR